MNNTDKLRDNFIESLNNLGVNTNDKDTDYHTDEFEDAHVDHLWVTIKAEIAELTKRRDEIDEIVKAVANIGVDFGYGEFQLSIDHIEKARKALSNQ